jgi:hypothetical protein
MEITGKQIYKKERRKIGETEAVELSKDKKMLCLDC